MLSEKKGSPNEELQRSYHLLVRLIFHSGHLKGLILVFTFSSLARWISVHHNFYT